MSAGARAARAAVEREYRTIGPPGTGKTTWVSKQMKRAADAGGAANVLVASLTKAAAEEIAGRDSPVPRKNIGTLHSHAYTAIGKPKLCLKDKALMAQWNEEHPLWKLGGDNDMDDNEFAGVSEGDKLLLAYSSERSRLTNPETWTVELRAFSHAWEDFKRETSSIDYTDMIELARDNTESAPGDPHFMFLDEAQDVDRMQMQLVRIWAKNCLKLIVVGDPDQNLYEWRGTDATSFSDPPLPEDRTRVLEQSYRVPAAVHAFATSWIQKSSTHLKAEYRPRDAAGELEEILLPVSNPIGLPDMIEKEIEAGRTCMVLTSCAYMLHAVKDVISAAAIPYHNPYRLKKHGWNPLRLQARVRAFLAPDEEFAGEAARLWNWKELERWTGIVRTKGLVRHGRKKLIVEKAKDTPDKLVTPAELHDLFENLEAIPIGDLKWFQSVGLASMPKSVEYVTRCAERHGKKVIDETPKVVIGTIHSVKGGEADTVFLFPDISRQGARSLQTREGFDAMVRQFYVGMTRAREKLVVCRQHTRPGVFVAPF